jgi:hypothetical protein
MKKSLIFLSLLIPSFLVSAQGGGPWQHRVFRAVSTDGMTWTKDTTLLFFPASVPSVVMDTNQNVFLYYVHMDNPFSPESLFVAVSPDGQYFYAPQSAVFTGSTVTRKVDPDAVILPDGRIRLYYIDFDMQPPQDVHSAISNDGINFTEEPGIRFSDPTGITDPDVFSAAGKWNMYVSKGTQLLRATSIDGLTFAMDSSFAWNKGAVSCTHMFSCGLYRTYFCGSGKILSATSGTGDTLVMESGVRLAPDVNEFICDPTMLRLYSGEYVMYYKSYVSGTGIAAEQSCSCNQQLNAYPNPFTNSTYIDIPDKLANSKELQLDIFDFTGSKVYSCNVNSTSDRIEIRKANLKQGLFYFYLSNKRGIAGKGKFEIINN